LELYPSNPFIASLNLVLIVDPHRGIINPEPGGQGDFGSRFPSSSP
jgi:hypothetical protein